MGRDKNDKEPPAKKRSDFITRNLKACQVQNKGLTPKPVLAVQKLRLIPTID